MNNVTGIYNYFIKNNIYKSVVERTKRQDYWPTIINFAKAFDMDIVVFDLETTGIIFKAPKFSITEIGLVRITKSGAVETFETLVKPEIRVSEKVTNITGITQDMVDRALPIEQVWPNICDVFTDALVCGFNSKAYDLPALDTILRKKNLELIAPRATLDLRQIPKFNKKLIDSARSIGINPELSHKALDDAKTTASLLEHGLKFHKEMVMSKVVYENKVHTAPKVVTVETPKEPTPTQKSSPTKKKLEREQELIRVITEENRVPDLDKFAEFFGVKPQTVKNQIRELEKKELIPYGVLRDEEKVKKILEYFKFMERNGNDPREYHYMRLKIVIQSELGKEMDGTQIRYALHEFVS
jgi:DNA polymerase III alpha subunit (gram-positive type)